MIKIIGVAVGGIAAVSLAAVAVLFLYINIRYARVDRQLRFVGWFMNLFCRYDTKEKLMDFSRKMQEKKLPLPEDPDMDIREEFVSLEDGRRLSVIVYQAKQVRPEAVGLLWIHGGGYAMGTARNELSSVKEFVLTTNTIAVSPDYTLSTEAPYPTALREIYSALRWMKDSSKELGINPKQIFVAGSSAGGGLAAAVTLYARDQKEVDIAFHMPLFPMINDRMDTASMKGNREFLWNENSNRAGWQLYLGELYGTEKIPKYASVLRETNFLGMPPAYTCVGDLDPFYDETLEYIRRLSEAGTETRCDTYKGGFHGFIGMPNAKISKEARARLLSAYQYAAAHYYTKENG